MAAEGSSAGTDASQHLGFVSHSDLSELYSHSENCGQILYKFSEVNSSVRCEIEYYLGVIEGIFHVYEFHLKTAAVDFFLAEFHGAGFFLLVFLMLDHVLVGCDPDDGLERSHDLAVINFGVCHGHFAELRAPCGLYYYVISCFKVVSAGIKVVYLACGLESYSYYCYHISILLYLKNHAP